MKKVTANTTLADKTAKRAEVLYSSDLTVNRTAQPEALETFKEVADAFTVAQLLRPLVVTAAGNRPDGKYISLPYGTAVGYLKEHEDSDMGLFAEVGLAALVKAGFVERGAEETILKPPLGWESAKGAVELLGTRLVQLVREAAPPQ